MSKSWKNVLISPDKTIRDALLIINREALRVALVADDSLNLLGIITDGDVRRGLLRDMTLDSSVIEVMNTSPLTASVDESKGTLSDLMNRYDVLSVPLMKEGKIVGLETLHDILERPRYENPIFLMAGGFGKRLRPLTNVCPKPMLKVGDKPILEIMLNSFVKAGFVNFYISTHYMPEVITEYFGDGSKWKVSITYVHEDVPLGTGGALGLLPKEMPDLPIIMMNADVLTKFDYQRLLEYHNEHRADVTMGVRDFEYQIPFGVINADGNKVISMEEKPVHRFFVNAGIYVVSQQVARSVPPNHQIDMPSLIEEKMACQGHVVMFPIHDYWLDIGRLEDFNRAQCDIRSLDI